MGPLGQAPAVAVQPAGVIRVMHVAPQRMGLAPVTATAPAPDLSPRLADLSNRLDTQQKQIDALPKSTPDLGDLPAKVAALQQQVAALPAPISPEPLSPVGLSTVTKLAPERMVGSMMGVWFLASALGNFVGGRIAGLFETVPLTQLFGAVSLTTGLSALVLLILVKPIRRLMGGVQ